MLKPLIFVVAAVLTILAGNATATAQEFEDLSIVQLEKQLNAILKTRRDEEKAYIKSIVKLVEEGKLPRRLVHSSFKYVINKRPYTKYPFVYFVRVLKFQTAKEKISIPKFDFKIYSTRS